MASDKVQHLTDGNFDSTIQGSAVPVLVDFWAEWCAPCRRLSPTVDAVAAELEGKLLVAKVNVDENPVTPGRFGVRGIPTLILFKGGKIVDQVVGLVSKDELKQILAPHAS
jgi:thioredoxin 1